MATFSGCQTRFADRGDGESRADETGPQGSSFASFGSIACVFLPFAAGYYLSYLFRTINALIAYPLAVDLGLGAADLGLLTAAYFLVLTAAQIPIGMLLDRFGPRRVQAVLLTVAAAGAALFGRSTGFLTLLVARAMLGLGVAAALMAGLKAIVIWFPKERVALMNGYMIMLGGLGAVTATAPAEWLLNWIGWRGLFDVLGLATIATGAMIFLVVPEHGQSPAKGLAPIRLQRIYTDPRFWRMAPLSAGCVGSAWALQALWAAPWLTDVERLDRKSLVGELSIMAIGLSVGALLLGTVADRLRRRGLRTEVSLSALAVLMIGAELALIFRLPLPLQLPWSVVSLAGAATVLSYAVIAEYFPSGLAGRANGCLNVLHFGWAFLVQYGIGLVVEQWSPERGHYPVVAYQAAFALVVALQALTLVWFIVPWLMALCRSMAGSFLHERTSEGAVQVTIPPADKVSPELKEWEW